MACLLANDVRQWLKTGQTRWLGGPHKLRLHIKTRAGDDFIVSLDAFTSIEEEKAWLNQMCAHPNVAFIVGWSDAEDLNNCVLFPMCNKVKTKAEAEAIIGGVSTAKPKDVLTSGALLRVVEYTLTAWGIASALQPEAAKKTLDVLVKTFGIDRLQAMGQTELGAAVADALCKSTGVCNQGGKPAPQPVPPANGGGKPGLAQEQIIQLSIIVGLALLAIILLQSR